MLLVPGCVSLVKFVADCVLDSEPKVFVVSGFSWVWVWFCAACLLQHRE